MFKLTREEQLIVAFLLFALLLGMTVREWRTRHRRVAAAAALEIKGH
jgi:hypothetical protein